MLSRDRSPLDILPFLAPSDALKFGQLLKQAPQASILICPNDARGKASFEPTMRGHRWIPELYSSLLLHLNEFKQ